MMNFKNFFFHLSLVQLVTIAALIFYFNSCRKCKVCAPCAEVHQTHSVTHDTIFVEKQIATDKIKLVKHTDGELSFVSDQYPCDSLYQVLTEENEYEIPLQDSNMYGHITAAVSSNKIRRFSTSFNYIVRSTVDTILVDKPAESKPMNCFTVGIFAGDQAEVMNAGYRINKIHLLAGYNFYNKGLVVGFNYDLR